SDMDGLLNWFRPGNARSRHYTGGFSTRLLLLASRYAATPTTPPLRLDAPSENLRIVAGEGNLPTEMVKVATYASNNRVLVDKSDPEKLKMTVVPTSGIFRGTFIHPATGKPARYSGAILQKQNLAAGHFL